jgi:hypothetical protein
MDGILIFTTSINGYARPNVLYLRLKGVLSRVELMVCVRIPTVLGIARSCGCYDVLIPRWIWVHTTRQYGTHGNLYPEGRSVNWRHGMADGMSRAACEVGPR